MLSDKELQLKALELRLELIETIYGAGAGHTGGSLSCIDILILLYNRILNVSPEMMNDPGRDRYIQSKGHSVEALYVVLADAGFFPRAELKTLGRYQSHFVGHPTRKVPGVEQNTGALGHGLSMSVGCALGAKLDERDFRVITLLGDGEIAEGSNWEGAMAAAHYNLDNLTAIIDCNTLQITGRTFDVMNNEPLSDKFAAFGWTVREVDGHDFAALTDALRNPLEKGKPSAIIARTTKGKGISYMEDVGKWHHGVPDADQYAAAIAELQSGIEQARKEVPA